MAACAVAGAMPDIDFLLPLRHRGPSHGLGTAVLAFAASLLVLQLRAGLNDRLRIAAAVGLAYASHTLLDWLGADSSAPRGLMALWPVSSAYYISGVDIFNSVDRRYWLPGFWVRNTMALLRELAILGPVAALAVLAGWRSRSSPGGGSP